MTHTTSSGPAAATGPDVATARIAGVLYLAVGISGMLGFLLIRPQLFDAGDAAATTANLLAGEALARVAIGLEMVLVLTQALTALWLYRMFRPVRVFDAIAVGSFGTINAAAILGSAAFLATALDLAITPSHPGASQAMYLVSENFWGIGNLFFGLWLIPMGRAVRWSRWAPAVLGWILIAGGAGYLLSAFVGYLLPQAPGPLLTILVLPATVGEFWMIGWLLSRRRIHRAA